MQVIASGHTVDPEQARRQNEPWELWVQSGTTSPLTGNGQSASTAQPGLQ